jgi:hypothetical protein
VLSKLRQIGQRIAGMKWCERHNYLSVPFILVLPAGDWFDYFFGLTEWMRGQFRIGAGFLSFAQGPAMDYRPRYSSFFSGSRGIAFSIGLRGSIWSRVAAS